MTEAPVVEREPDVEDATTSTRGDRFVRMRSTASHHWLFLVILGAGTALRVITQIAYRPALLFIDSYQYLAALHTFDPTGNRTLGYNFLVLWPLLHLGNLFVVAVVQHVIGLAMGVAIYVLCLRYGVSRWLAAAAAAPILLDAYQLQIEQNIMSETLFEALLLGAMVVLLWHARPRIGALVAGGLLLGLSVPVRVVSLPLVIPAAIFACVCGTGGWRRVQRAAIVTLAFLIPVVGYMAFYHSKSGDWGLSTTDARAAFGRAAQIADCDALSLPDYERGLCPSEPLGERRGVDYYAHHFPLYRRAVIPPGQTLEQVLRDFSRRVFRQQPLDVTRAIAIDVAKGFRWSRTDARGDVPVARWQFQKTWQYQQRDPRAATEEWGGGPPTIVRPLASFLRGYQLSIGYTPGPVFLVAFLGGVLGGLGVGRARRSGVRAVCWLPTVSGIAVVVIADLFEFSWRYQLPMLVFAPLAGAIGFTAIFREPDRVAPALLDAPPSATTEPVA